MEEASAGVPVGLYFLYDIQPIFKQYDIRCKVADYLRSRQHQGYDT